ncbi:tRNA (adenosine(37)-N6)-threonylcarbamoyltransferase complex dimerization subunit type 1 TsaB [Microbacterium barkeri]|uniref:tRNA (Adenosine(37)-N6)-threonylcarbamoyltransferase complex dimerization subunit type 1 TsaB n=1 Tax=Microbacterium barkeri TaxID=33917 RepID=A0A9W6LVC9_9MICO|nr:tRNA (adenosine(37)-N6)-threonylcarbamoyltransferase complex dimerization subunit type 1 TsaB [Microbacterium barkeri]MDR6875214.1 tRNA threonylcarbamoyl adenosine modification protein YeaZ [Microbacterium barkeri]GLJ60624.1 tRNA (adenosine(37)-N6)-threonylcarbamoyltransferase complex dimerization subunit type 1 TsaB [Microbacterium barkeri]
MILAVDTSIGSGAAVVAPDGEILSEAESENALGHAEVIGTLLERALADAGVGPDRITHVAAGMGPGPFTGLRIGIAAARAFALGRGVPVLGIASHDAVAAELTIAFPTGGFAVATDARRRENAISVYGDLDGWGLPRRIAGPELRPRDADLSADPLLAPLRDLDGDRFVLATRIPIGALGRLAAIRLRAGETRGATEPLYLRSPDVTAPAPRKRVGS